jgi:hypothetical protein
MGRAGGDALSVGIFLDLAQTILYILDMYDFYSKFHKTIIIGLGFTKPQSKDFYFQEIIFSLRSIRKCLVT